MSEGCSADASIPILLINHKLYSYSTNGGVSEIKNKRLLLDCATGTSSRVGAPEGHPDHRLYTVAINARVEISVPYTVEICPFKNKSWGT